MRVAKDVVHGVFLRLENFLLQDCASWRNAPRISLPSATSEHARVELFDQIPF
jgi:hypothetical protein